MRDEDQAHIFLDQVQDGAVRNLRREAESRLRTQVPPRVHIREHNLHAELRKERRVEWKERVCRQRPGNADAGAACHSVAVKAAQRLPHKGLRAFIGGPHAPVGALHSLRFWRGGGSGRGDLEEHLGSFLDQILSRCGPGLSLPHILIETAAAPERKPASCDFEPVDAAVHLAGATCKPADKFHLRCAECEQIDGMTRHIIGSFQGEEPDPERAEQFRAGRDHDLTADTVGEGIADRAVQRDATLQEDFLSHVARSLDAIQIISGNGIDETGDDVVAGMALLLGETNVGIDEGRAGRLEMHRGGGGQRQVGDVRDADAEVAMGALFQEGARAC